jgi:O-antigen/teichoic acid export membrane protein
MQPLVGRDGIDMDRDDRVGGAGARRRRVSSLLQSPTARQAAIFTCSGLLTNALAVVSTAILTRNLGPNMFGSLAFATSLLAFVALLFEFGLFVPAARLAAVADTEIRPTVVGAALVLYIPIGIAFSATIFGLSFFVDDWFHVTAGHALRVAAPLAIVFPFLFVLQQLAQGVSRLHIASITTVLAQLFLVGLLGLWLGVGGQLNTSNALFLRALGFLVAALCGALWLRPAFRGARHWMPKLVRQAREWGFQQAIGRLFSIGTYNMDVIMLGFWATPRSVGLYVLAGSLATASGFPVMGLASALFGRMAREAAIARRWIIIASAVGAGCALFAWLIAEPVIRLFFSARYAAAAGLVLPLAVAQCVRGVTTIFNTFLSAHAHGGALRNAGLVLTVSNLAFNFALIPPYGARGAAWASLLALVANLIAHVFFYRRSYAL